MVAARNAWDRLELVVRCSGGLLQSAMLALGRLNSIFAGSNFLPIYYLGILFDQAVLLLGVFLLARRYFASNITVLFVSITALGSAAWFRGRSPAKTRFPAQFTSTFVPS